MTSQWLHYTILRAASFLTPADRRADWLMGWRSELWYIPPRGATAFCLGAFQDALWVRRNSPRPAPGIEVHLESPFLCLAFLALLAAVSSLIALRLPGGPPSEPGPANLRGPAFVDGCTGMLFLSSGLLTAMRVQMGRSGREPRSVTWQARLRLGIFLALKIALIQPILFCGLLLFSLAPAGPMALWLFWAVPCRWVLMDQPRRCPVCLRLLTTPIRIGCASQTFLEWYGAESTCSRGHGLLHIPETSASYSANPEWLALGDSWSGLFSRGPRRAVTVRQP
jgi:hypothetical protein